MGFVENSSKDVNLKFSSSLTLTLFIMEIQTTASSLGNNSNGNPNSQTEQEQASSLISNQQNNRTRLAGNISGITQTQYKSAADSKEFQQVFPGVGQVLNVFA